MTKTTQEKFDYSGGNPIATTTEYIYDEDDSDGHQTQPIETQVTNSDGTKHITRIKYSCDYALGLSTNGGDAMTQALHHMQNTQPSTIVQQGFNQIVPIEQTTLIQESGWSQPKVIGGQLSTYQLKSVTQNGQTNSFIVPHETYSIETEQPISNFIESSIDISTNTFVDAPEYYLQGTITQTDDKGNLEEYARNHGETTAIIWDNVQNLPLAKVINASHNEVFYTSFEEDVNTSTYAAKTGLYSKTIQGNYTIPGSTNFPTGEYLLTYWKKIGTGDFTFHKEIINYTNGNSIDITVGQGFLDEVRLYPSDAVMSSVAYYPLHTSHAYGK